MMPRFRFAPHGRERLHELECLLDQAHGAPESLLGNQADPLDEAVYIILSFQTDLARFKETWQKLRSTFPRWSDVEQATLNDLSAALRSGGLHRQKATAIKRLLRAVRRQFGELSLDALHQMGDAEAERTLTRLPGMSWKGARCVLLYSLHREVFPIDGNSFRVLQRAGVIPLSAVYRRLSLHDAVQEAVDPWLRRRFHVNLVVHGQEVCLPQRPRCEACPAASLCPRRGLPWQPTDPSPSRVAVAELTVSSRQQAQSGGSFSRRSPPDQVAVAG
jgi:endonuclease III